MCVVRGFLDMVSPPLLILGGPAKKDTRYTRNYPDPHLFTIPLSSFYSVKFQFLSPSFVAETHMVLIFLIFGPVLRSPIKSP